MESPLKYRLRLELLRQKTQVCLDAARAKEAKVISKDLKQFYKGMEEAHENTIMRINEALED